MYLLVSILAVFAAVLMILIVLVQNSQGGGLASNFSGSNQYMGVRKTTDFLEKATWFLAGAILFLCVVAIPFIDRGEVSNESMMQQQIETAVDPNAVPSFPTAVPEVPATKPAASKE